MQQLTHETAVSAESVFATVQQADNICHGIGVSTQTAKLRWPIEPIPTRPVCTAVQPGSFHPCALPLPYSSEGCCVVALGKHGHKYYVYDDEELPARKLQLRSHVTNMFLAVVGRSRFDPAASRMLSMTIGIFPFTEQREAQRNGRNKVAVTMETKCVEVTKERTRQFSQSSVIDLLAEGRKPSGSNDTPSPNIISDPVIIEACTADG